MGEQCEILFLKKERNNIPFPLDTARKRHFYLVRLINIIDSQRKVMAWTNEHLKAEPDFDCLSDT
jgi:hypothetical protein